MISTVQFSSIYRNSKRKLKFENSYVNVKICVVLQLFVSFWVDICAKFVMRGVYCDILILYSRNFTFVLCISFCMYMFHVLCSNKHIYIYIYVVHRKRMKRLLNGLSLNATRLNSGKRAWEYFVRNSKIVGPSNKKRADVINGIRYERTMLCGTEVLYER